MVIDYFRAERVINSCTNLEQLSIALNYVELYYKTTNDRLGYEILIRKYNKLTEELSLDDIV